VGRRRSRFLGGFYAFPGGAAEPRDGDPDGEQDARLRRTAARELLEETGLHAEPGALLDAGRRVTPPFFPRRFDTAMYVAAFPGEPPPAPRDPGEMEDLHWTAPAEAMRRWRALEIRVAPPLIPMLQELERITDPDPAAVARRLRDRNAAMEGGDGPHIEFVPDVLMVPLETATLPPATTTNAYLVGAGDVVVVDPGGAGGEAERLVRHVRRRLAETGGRAAGIVLTHHHGDHVGGAAAAAGALGAAVHAHPETWTRWPEGAGLRAAGLARELRDGDRLELSGGERLRALHTPGHAPGHLALLEETRGSLFAGDLVSGLSTILIDSGPGDFDLFLASLERIRDSGARTLFPAHGPPMISPADDVQRVLDHRREREERILAALAGGASSVEAIAREAYADTPEAPPALAAAQVAANLRSLERRGLARRAGTGWGPGDGGRDPCGRGRESDGGRDPSGRGRESDRGRDPGDGGRDPGDRGRDPEPGVRSPRRG
jgi:glyoxylase-like metal-dependent hydrolase (beta-lactamase superfamily II)/8-oxo-dGTP pyrophosphatase MutT (NUDIX family)